MSIYINYDYVISYTVHRKNLAMEKIGEFSEQNAICKCFTSQLLPFISVVVIHLAHSATFYPQICSD